ncbi:hypothetical protein E2C01_077752 [Portunus trituberculatus]|uniref:Uncharacterized protein n=1 Tax=Portunus trituberculatus TaxID=210409 RepID=A0A5B7IGU1_PORTR|nr:hypothetical protein [Portunus trituberculatus]
MSSSSSASPVHHGCCQSCHVYRSPAQTRTPTTHASLPEPSWRVVLDELVVLSAEVAKLSANTQPSLAQEVNFQASTSTRHHSPANFSGFVDDSSEEGGIMEVTHRGIVLLQNAKNLGLPDTVSGDTDDKIAGMVNFLFE